MAGQRVAKCKTVATAQELVQFLKDKTQGWQPPVKFCMLLRPDGVEVCPDRGSPLREADRLQIRQWVNEFMSTRTAATEVTTVS